MAGGRTAGSAGNRHYGTTKADIVLNAQRTLELAKNAYFLYLTQKPAEQAELLKRYF